jgi:hypothetical protein
MYAVPIHPGKTYRVTGHLNGRSISLIIFASHGCAAILAALRTYGAIE